MIKVYVVLEDVYYCGEHSRTLSGVFETEKSADDFCARQRFPNNFNVDEVEVRK